MTGNDKVTNVLFCGVGGQGIILASNIMANVALKAGFDVKKSEIHGMAQRGGNVDSHVRFGKKVYSPIIPAGEVDYVVALELVEPLRWAHLLRKDTVLLVNEQKIHSLYTATGIAEYPSNAKQAIAEAFPNAVFVDALGIAKELGNSRVVNTIMLGMLAKRLQIDKEVWLEVLRSSLKPKIVEVNLSAFERGWSLA